MLTREGYTINKNKLSQEEYEKLKTELTVKPLTNKEYARDTESFTVYRETPTDIVIPRYYGIKKMGNPENKIDITDSIADFEFNGQLRENQMEVAKTIIENLNSKGGGILQLHTGYGKTTIALYLASVLKLKTLVIVHKTFLQDQWYDRIKQFTNANIGMIRQKKTDVDGKDIIIGMLQSISMIDYDPKIFKDIGLLIVDECFPGYTLIQTEKGFMKIEDLYHLWNTNQYVPLVKSFNQKSQCFELKKITYAWVKKKDNLIRIHFNNTHIDCTPNHKFLTTKGYKKALKLTVKDILVENNQFYGLNSDQIQVVIGSYLAKYQFEKLEDGRYIMITKSKGISKYKKWKNEILHDTPFDFPYDLTSNESFEKIVDMMDLRGVSIWISEVYELDPDYTYIRIPFNNYDQKSLNILYRKLVRIGLKPGKSDGYFYTTDKYDQLGPYYHYKIRSNLDFNNFSSYRWNNEYEKYGTARIKKITKLPTQKTDVYDIEVEDNHNFLVHRTVVHNCHHIGSKVFSKALLKIGAKHTIGLSATPVRADGLTKVLKWFLGDILVKVERKGDNKVFIKSFEYKGKSNLFVEKMRWFKGKIKPDSVKMITNMYRMQDRNDFICNILTALRRQDERKILVLSGRIEHLKIMKKLVDQVIQSDVDTGVCEDGECRTSFYIGGMKDYELKDSADADIIFATYSMAEEGLDIDGLNTLVLATPKKNIIQSIGRIMRKPIKEGDISPLVVDIVDNLSVFKNWGNIRLKYYDSQKYTIHQYKASGEKCISFLNYMIEEGIINQNVISDDIRKTFILSKYGPDTYSFEEEIDFLNFPEQQFNYNPDFKQIFDLNSGIII